jgi:hypothetical protein
MGARSIWMAVFSLCLSCGGKMVGGGEAGTAQAGDNRGTEPPPPCDTICDRITSMCAGSPNQSCRDDCETTRTMYASCTAALDRFLVCMSTTRVACMPGEAVTIDCSDERHALEACR